MVSWLESKSDYALFILRVVVAVLFLSHGLQKTLGLLGGNQQPVLSLFGTAGLIELAGGLLILAGLLTRAAAFLCCGEMAVAYFTQHAPGGFWPIMNHGELAVLFCFLFLYLVFKGPGACSVDGLLHRGERR